MIPLLLLLIVLFAITGVVQAPVYWLGIAVCVVLVWLIVRGNA